MEQIFEKFERVPIAFKALALLVVLGGMYVGFNEWVQSPIESQIATVNGNIEKKRFELEDIRYKIQHLTEVEQEIRRLRNQLTAAVSLLPVRSELPALLRKLATLAEKSGLTIVRFRPMPEANRRYYFEVPVMLELSGSYLEVTNFFDQVGKMRRLVNISNVKMSRKDCEPNGFTNCQDPEVDLVVECRAVTYRFAAAALSADQ